jgi:hypothetical protein
MGIRINAVGPGGYQDFATRAEVDEEDQSSMAFSPAGNGYQAAGTCREEARGGSNFSPLLWKSRFGQGDDVGCQRR